MNNFQRVFLDTAPVIYYVQQNEMYFEKVKNIFARMIDEKVIFVASDITTAGRGVCVSLSSRQHEMVK